MSKIHASIALSAIMCIGSISASSVAFAGNAGSSLGDCYNHVISACNKKDNVDAAHACANSGMNACDKVHGASVSQIPGSTLQAMRSSTLRRAAPRHVGSAAR